MVFKTSVSTKAEPHYPAENPKELLYENSLVHQKNIRMHIMSIMFVFVVESRYRQIDTFMELFNGIAKKKHFSFGMRKYIKLLSMCLFMNNRAIFIEARLWCKEQRVWPLSRVKILCCCRMSSRVI
jgi:hypothetical protein